MAGVRGSNARTTDGAGDRLRIGDGFLEFHARTPDDLVALRRFVEEVNGPSCTQPYLVEEADGRFRLYVGSAAERERTEQGIRGEERSGEGGIRTLGRVLGPTHA